MGPSTRLKRIADPFHPTPTRSMAAHESSREKDTSVDSRPHLLALIPDEMELRLREHMAARGQPAYRVGQVTEWIYRHLAVSFDEMTNLPVAEREALDRAFRIGEPEAHTISRSTDGTVKHLWQMADGELVESVLIPSGDRLTLCLSSQAGCAMGCTFCATGWGGFGRQLTIDEIVTQYRSSARWLRENGREPITNVVFMGMGEPLANRKAVHPALTILNQGFDLGARRITVSTVGVIPGIRELAVRPEQFGLALSLHSPVEGLRAELIPLEKRYPLPELLDALREFRDAGGRRITFEYTMIRDVNDAPELAPLLAGHARDLGAFVNLIPFNPIPDQDWLPSRPDRIEHFRRTLEGAGVSAAVREPRGRDIDAACGQLRANALVQIEGRPRPRAGQRVGVT
ncbi:MAG: 23S rRNA (adenine(2503)-C(2))-methyltransferase RlmN [Gemmatimonadales bacterium]|nr:MAG: 23S rRNA (adenine(2503)-C(2))-methyltransferase RlmN [Gemmatimonadales bacterium]